jgi:hypothetical protein
MKKYFEREGNTNKTLPLDGGGRGCGWKDAKHSRNIQEKS